MSSGNRGWGAGGGGGGVVGGRVRVCVCGGGCEMNWRSNVAECQRLYSETEAKKGGGDGVCVGGGGGVYM